MKKKINKKLKSKVGDLLDIVEVLELRVEDVFNMLENISIEKSRDKALKDYSLSQEEIEDFDIEIEPQSYLATKDIEEILRLVDKVAVSRSNQILDEYFYCDELDYFLNSLSDKEN